MMISYELKLDYLRSRLYFNTSAISLYHSRLKDGTLLVLWNMYIIEKLLANTVTLEDDQISGVCLLQLYIPFIQEYGCLHRDALNDSGK